VSFRVKEGPLDNIKVHSMKSSIISFALMLFAVANLCGQKQLFELDKGHSYIEFSVGYLGMMQQRGQFEQFDAAMVYDESNPYGTSMTININTASINTNHNFRDKHLKSPDFFDVDKYPMIRFESSEISKDNSELKISGELTLHGNTKSVEIPLSTTGILIDWEGKKRIGFEGEFQLNRKDFGILGGNKFNSRFVKDRVIADTVTVSYSIQGIIKNSTNWEPSVRALSSLKETPKEVLLDFENSLKAGKDEAMHQIIIFYTLTDALIYDENGRDMAITILRLIEKSEYLDERTQIGVYRKLATAHWVKGDATGLSA